MKSGRDSRMRVSFLIEKTGKETGKKKKEFWKEKRSQGKNREKRGDWTENAKKGLEKNGENPNDPRLHLRISSGNGRNDRRMSRGDSSWNEKRWKKVKKIQKKVLTKGRWCVIIIKRSRERVTKAARSESKNLENDTERIEEKRQLILKWVLIWGLVKTSRNQIED